MTPRGLLQHIRHQRRQPPVLTGRIEIVGRCSDAGIRAEQRCVGLHLATVHDTAYGQILNQTDLHACCQRLLLTALQLPARQPLQPQVAIRIRKPGMAGEALRTQPARRLKPRESRKTVAAFLHKQRKIRRPAGRVASTAESLVHEPQALQLEPVHCRVVDEITLARRCNIGPETTGLHQHLHGFRSIFRTPGQVQVKRVQEAPVVRTVRAGIVGVAQVRAVQRVQQYKGCSLLCGQDTELVEVGEITHAPIGSGAQGIKLGRQAP